MSESLSDYIKVFRGCLSSQDCIEIINSISESYNKQIEAVEINNWEEFHKNGKWIGGLADLYQKLCK